MVSLFEARKIVEEYQRELPVNVIGLAEALGARVYRTSEWPDNISGMIHIDEELGGSEDFVIYVNAKHHLNRRRFTIAHELSHIMLHDHLIGNGITTDGLYRSGLGGGVERAANQSAANILMPWPKIRELLAQGVTSVEELARKFQVSRSAMAIQLDWPWALEWDHPSGD